LDPANTLAPIVNVAAAPTIIMHWNDAVPAAPGVVNPAPLNATNSPYLARFSDELRAKERMGLVLLEYRQGTNFLGVQVVDLREPDPLSPAPLLTSADIGFTLAPDELRWHGTGACGQTVGVARRGYAIGIR
jgi:hypothetical protein